MDETTKQTVSKLMLKSMRGTNLSEDEQKFCEQVYRQFPGEYASLHKEVWTQAAKELNQFA